MKDISKDIISKIKDKHIQPKPKWHFLLKNWFFWGVFGFSIIIGGISVSIIFFQIITNEWDIARRMAGSLVYFALLSLPYFWVLILVGFSFLANHYIRQTKKGYKYTVLTINLISISLSIVLGLILFTTGMSFHINRMMHERMPMFDRFTDMHHELLMDEDNGVIVGEIKLISEDEIEVIDLNGKAWKVDTRDSIKKYLDKANIGDKVIVIGEIQDSFIKAEIIRSGERGNRKEMPFFRRFRQEEMMPPPRMSGEDTSLKRFNTMEK